MSSGLKMEGVKHLVRHKEVCLDPAEQSGFLIFVKKLLIFVNRYAAFSPENNIYRTVAVLKQVLGPKTNLSHFSFHLAVAT